MQYKKLLRFTLAGIAVAASFNSFCYLECRAQNPGTEEAASKSASQEKLSGYYRARRALEKKRRDSFSHLAGRAASYVNKGMGISTNIPANWKVSELSDRAMRAGLSEKDNSLTFTATSSDINERVSLDWYYDEASKRLPRGWQITKAERTQIDGVPAIAIEVKERRGKSENYRQRVYVIKSQKLFVFDVMCPISDMAKNNSLIKGIWSNLRFTI